MGDVVGHGIGAAALMGQLRNALRAYALEATAPAEVVEQLDRLVQPLEQGRMATLLYVVDWPGLRAIRYVERRAPAAAGARAGRLRALSRGGAACRSASCPGTSSRRARP